MPYPKPLSEKTLNRMYADAKLEGEKKEFLQRLFRAASNLYGVIELAGIWYVYKEYAKIVTVPRLRKKDIIAFSAIARRENVPYYIFEIDEVYRDEPRKDDMRFLVKREIVKTGYAKFYFLWMIIKMQGDTPVYIPTNLLDFEKMPVSDQEKKLRNFLRKLKVTAKEAIDRFGKISPCANIGKQLGRIDFMNKAEQEVYEYLREKAKAGGKASQAKLDKFLENHKGPESDKIVRRFMLMVRSGWGNPQQNMKIVLKELNEVGVKLDKKHMMKLEELLNEVNENTHLWVTMGWTFMDLLRLGLGDVPMNTQFRTEIEKTFAEGLVDRYELTKMLEEKGVKVIK